MEYGVGVPYDSGSGQVSGARIHRPFVVRMNVEKNWPLLFRAMLNNETLIVVLHWVRPGVGSYYEIELEGAKIADIRQVVLHKPDGYAHVIDVEMVALKTTLRSGGNEHTDDWGEGP